MICTRCSTAIAKDEKYHRTRKGPHHATCPHVSVAIPNDGGPVVIMRDDKHSHSIDWSAIVCLNCGNPIYLTGITNATWFHKDNCQNGCGENGLTATPDLNKAIRGER